MTTALSETLLVLSLATCVIGAASQIAPAARNFGTVVLAAAVQAAAAFGAGSIALLGGPGSEMALWRVASLGRMVLALDPIGGLFMVVTAVVFFAGAVIAARDAERYSNRRFALFVSLYQLLFAAVLLVLAVGDVLSFAIGWELMSLLIFALVVFEYEPGGRPAYVMLAMSEAGTIAGLVGLLILAHASAGLDFVSLRAGAPGFSEELRRAAFLLTFFGFGVKAGLVPVNHWLPPAYAAAPRGFAPFLAGATTNLGIYAVLRFDAALLGPSVETGLIVLVVGGISALVGILYATIQTDMRRMLAHSSIENMGIIAAAIGAGMVFAASGHGALAAIAFIAALYHLGNHAVYKTLLFAGAGELQARVGTADMDKLGGLIRRMPWIAAAFLVGVLGIATLPPLNGFVSEWLTFQTMLQSAALGSKAVKVVFALVGAALALTAGLAVTCFVKAFAMSFLGVPRSREAATLPQTRSVARAPMAALAVLCILLGVLPTYVIPIIDRAVQPIAGQSGTRALVPPFFSPDKAASEGFPSAFLSEFHDLGAGVGKSVIPGRGLVVLHRGGERNPVVFAMSTSYSMIVLAVLLALTLAGILGVTRRRSLLRGTVWAGGVRHLRSSETYTATGFSNPVRVVFHAVLRPVTIEDTTEAVADHFRTAIRREYAEEHILDRIVFDPAVAAVRWLARMLRQMHIGQVNAYAAYVLIALLTVFIIGLGAY